MFCLNSRIQYLVSTWCKGSSLRARKSVGTFFGSIRCIRARFARFLSLWLIVNHLCFSNCWLADWFLTAVFTNFVKFAIRLPIPQDRYLYLLCFFFQRGKQRWQEGDTFDDHFDSINFNARNNSMHRNDRRFSNPHRNQDYRSFEERPFDSRTSSNPRKGNKDFISNRGFRFNNEPRRKKSNPQYLKRYTFWILIAVGIFNQS